jgi:hypothetical protein
MNHPVHKKVFKNILYLIFQVFSFGGSWAGPYLDFERTVTK